MARPAAVVKRMGKSFAVYRRGASCLLAPCCSDTGASNTLAPHRITSSPALIAGDTPDAFALISRLQTVYSRYRPDGHCMNSATTTYWQTCVCGPGAITPVPKEPGQTRRPATTLLHLLS